MVSSARMSHPEAPILHQFYKLIYRNSKVIHAVCEVRNADGLECFTKIKAEQNGKIKKYNLSRHLQRMHPQKFNELMTNRQTVSGAEPTQEAEVVQSLIALEHAKNYPPNEAAKEAEPPSKRQRLSSQHSWTDSETFLLLEGVAAEIKGNSAFFEKPTADEFYKNVVEKTPSLAHISFESMKGKMRHFKNAYVVAVKWMNTTGAQLLANGEDQSVAEYIENSCPRWEHLQKIFGCAKSELPIVKHEATLEFEDTDFSIANCVYGGDVFTVLHVTDDEESVDTPDNIDASIPETIISESSPLASNAPKETMDRSQQTTPKTSKTTQQNDSLERSQQTTQPTERLDKSQQTTPKSFKGADPYSMLISLHEKKLQMEFDKCQHEMEMTKKDMEMKEKKLEQDFEIRKLQIESEERIRKYELELKLKYQIG